MADLTFVDSHNMVAYLEKSEDNTDFAEIVDFLNASPIRYALTTIIITESSMRRDLHFDDEDAVFNDEYDTPSHTKKVFANMRRQGKYVLGIMTPLFATMLIQPQADVGEGSGQPTESQHTPTTVSSSSHPKKTQKHRKIKRKATEISQSSGPTTLVADETIHEDRGDSVERAATTTTSLNAEQGSGGSPRRQDTILGDRPAQTSSCLGNIKTAQDLEITNLKKRVKKLEKKKKSRTPQLKRRLFKVRIESSAEKSLGDQEDASKQGRNEIDQDEGISWFQEDAETQGRYGHDIEINTASTSITTASINITTAEPVTTASAPITTAGVSVSTAEPSTPPTTTTLIEDEDLTIAQTLMKMRSVKSKEKSKEKGVSSETATRLTRGVIMKEASETAKFLPWKENVKDAQALEIKKLKKRVKKLESKKKSRIPQLKRRLFKFQEDAKTPERYGHDIITVEVTIASAPSDMDVSAASPIRPVDDSITDDITLAETLMKIKSNKGKGIMQEPEKTVKVKGKDQIEYDADVAYRLQVELDEEAKLETEREEEASKAANIAEWDDVQTMMDADYELAAKLQA
ncbi:hypothetical protein Tco_1310502 [Tanacetum coccineum]